MIKVERKIPYVITILLGVIFAFSILFSLIVLISMENLWIQTRDLYQHPLLVQNATSEIGLIEYAARDILHDYVLEVDPDAREADLVELNMYYIEIDSYMQVVKDYYLGDIQDITNLEVALFELKTYDEETIRLVQIGDEDIALLRVHYGGIVNIQHYAVIDYLNIVRTFAANKGVELFNLAQTQRNNIIFYSITSAITLFIIIGIISIILRKLIVPPLKKITYAAECLANGDLDARVDFSKPNEFGYLANRFNHMADMIEEESYLSLSESEISTMMFEANTFKYFNQNLIKGLLKITNSQIAAIYSRNEDTNVFERIESIGMNINEAPQFLGNLFEGEIGIALASNQIEHFTNLNETKEILFSTVAGDYKIQEIITIPIHNGSEVSATITLGKVGQYQDLDMQLLKRLHNEITARYSSVLTLKSIKALVKQIESKNIELESQTKELFKQSNTLEQQNIELKIQKNQLNQANQLKNTFLSNMSHELRTPLNSVISLAYVLNRKLKDKIPLEEYQYLDVIERNGRNLLEMVNELLDLSRIESGKVEIKNDEFDVNQLMEETVKSLMIQAHNKGIGLNLVSNVKPEIIKTDKTLFTHIIMNLIGNAIKFTDEGSVDVKTTYQKGFLQVKVIDTGIGIESNQFETIFEEFRQVDESSSKKNGGAGLGLAISKKYVNLLGGELTVDSKIGIGSKFTLRIPVELAETINETIIEIDHEVKKQTILLIDDSLPATIQTKLILEDVGYDIQVANDGKQAIDYLSSHRPDGIILDLMMPEMDGFEVLKRIREMSNQPVIPVLILSSKLVTEEELSFLKTNHVFQLVQKGVVKKDELLLTVKRMLKVETHEDKQNNKSKKKSSNKMKVLIVEDNPDNMITIKALLGDEFKILEATDGQLGVDLAKQHKPDLIFMDLALPKIDGYMALTIIKGNKDLSQIPIIAMTAKAMAGNKEEILAYGFDGYISKPIDPDALSKVLEVHR